MFMRTYWTRPDESGRRARSVILMIAALVLVSSCTNNGGGNGTGNSGGGGAGGGYQDTWAYTHSDTDPDAGGLYGPLLFNAGDYQVTLSGQAACQYVVRIDNGNPYEPLQSFTLAGPGPSRSGTFSLKKDPYNVDVSAQPGDPGQCGAWQINVGHP